ncbi:MAG: hypothetical protein QOF52_959 [Propionibacteriaceae bacterium]|jgi:hypothetical protein|nr:hypothetical protein [Propionibacteriaceae bacterium]MDX6321101.1 hypothetical protein [Propionibacteriaceae bacterium]
MTNTPPLSEPPAKLQSLGVTGAAACVGDFCEFPTDNAEANDRSLLEDDSPDVYPQQAPR